MQKLREDQEKVLADLRSEMKERKRIIVQVPTGGGKTTIAAVAIAAAASRGKRVWFSAHRTEIIDQAIDRLEMQGVTPGVIRAQDETDHDAPVQVISIDTLKARIGSMKLPDPPDVWFWDECHHIAAETWLACMDYAKDAWHIGLSATPYRGDGSGLGCGFESVVVGPGPRELAALGILVEPKLFCPGADDGGLQGDVVETYKEYGEGRRGLVFCATVAQSLALEEEFNKAGVRCRHIDGTTTRDEREERLAQLRSGEIDVVTNVQVLTEGFDFPALGFISLARRTQSESLYVQMVGRGLRSAEGKADCIVLDHGANAIRFGHPLAHRPADLTGRAKSKRDAMPVEDRLRICETCIRVSPGGCAVCVHCGERFITKLPRQNKRAKLRRWDGRSNTKLAERRAAWDKMEIVRRQQGRNAWSSSYRYLKQFGCMPHEDDQLLIGAATGRYWRERSKGSKNG